MASKSFTIFLLLLFVQASSWARLPNESPTDPFASFFSSLTGSVQEIPSMPCSSSLYRGNAGGCGVCAQPVNDWRKKIPDLANRLVSTDASIAGNANRSAQRNPAKVNGALTSFNAAGLTAKTGREASDARAKNADGVKNEFEKCREEIGKACDKKRLAPEDTRIASAVLKACDDAAKQAGKFADDKKKDGAGLGNLSDLMNAASKALGAMQPQGGQNQSPSGISQPEQANMTAPAAAPELQTSKFENKTGNSAASVAFGNAEKKDGAGSIAVGGGNFPMGGSLTGLGENGERRIASASTDLGAHGTGSGSVEIGRAHV